MMVVTEEMLITGGAVVEVKLAAKAALTEKLKCPVNGREPDAGMPSFDRRPEFGDRQVFFDVEERFKYPVAFFAVLEALAGAILREKPLFIR
jgi:hypothetical protein